MVEISLSGSGEGPGWETSWPTLQTTFSPPAWPPMPPCRPHAAPALVSARLPRAAPLANAPLWNTVGAPPRALETSPCHASAPAAGAALSAVGRLQARSQGTESTDGW